MPVVVVVALIHSFFINMFWSDAVGVLSLQLQLSMFQHDALNHHHYFDDVATIINFYLTHDGR